MAITPYIALAAYEQRRLHLRNEVSRQKAYLQQTSEPFSALSGSNLVMGRRRVNVGWTNGTGTKREPKAPTEFELCVLRLGLTEKSCAESRELRIWCKENLRRCYIPEWLLKEWGIGLTESEL